MADRAHAILSASDANRWLHCPPSAQLTKDYPDSGSEYAARGTLAHALGELRLRKQYVEPMGPRKFAAAVKKIEADPLYEANIATSIDQYFGYVADVVHGFSSPPLIRIEQRVDFAHIAPDGFGTADCIVLGEGVLHVIDYKNGRSPVDAQDNAQLKLYALGALRLFGSLIAVESCTLAVVQPNVSAEPSVWEISRADLEAWGESVKPIAAQAHAGEGAYNAAAPQSDNDWCHWCRAKANCRARAEKALDVADLPAVATPLSLLTNAELGLAVTKATQIAAWLKEAQDCALAKILAGRDVPGYKAVLGRKGREYKDVDEALAYLVHLGVNADLLYERKPLTVAAMDKAVSALDKTLYPALVETGHVIPTAGKPTLVPQSDKREAYQPSTAAEDFADIEKTA